MTFIVPDCTSDAENLADAVAGLAAAGRRDLAVAHARIMLRVMWGMGWMVGVGDSVGEDKAPDWTPFPSSERG